MHQFNSIHQKKSYDTLLLCDHVLLYEKNHFTVKKNQAIAIKDGRICFVGPWKTFISPDLQKQYDQHKNGVWKTKRDARHSIPIKKQQTNSKKLNHTPTVYCFKKHLLCPGFVNTHTHLPMSMFRALADDLPLKEWLEHYIFPLENQFMTSQSISAGAMLSAMELIKAGITTVCDMYFHSHALAKAVDKAGLRAVIGVGIPDVQNTKKNTLSWKEIVQDLKNTYKNNPRIHAALAPHAPYTVSPNELKDIGKFSRAENVPISIHVAETKWEQKEIYKKYRKTPVQHLHQLGVTGHQSLFVHCVHINKKDMQIMKDTNTAMSYNPESNMKLSSGIAPVSIALQEGLRVGLGTDGAASNNNLNFFGEMSSGVKLQKLKYSDQAITARDILRMAFLGGAEALNMEKEIGSIEKGKWADIIAIDLQHPHLYPQYDLIAHLVYSAHGGEVDFVMCSGQVLMENGKIKTLDEDSIYNSTQKIERQIQKFLAKNQSPTKHIKQT